MLKWETKGKWKKKVLKLTWIVPNVRSGFLVCRAEKPEIGPLLHKRDSIKAADSADCWDTLSWKKNIIL